MFKQFLSKVKNHQPLSKSLSSLPRRGFSNYQKIPTPTNWGSYALIGAGTAGLVYLMLYGRTLLASQYGLPTYQAQQMHFFHPEVQRRIRQCMMYFGSGLGLTGIMVGAMRNSTLPFTVNPWLFLIGSIALLIGTQVTDIQFNPIIKHGLWLGFMGSMAFSLVPLISMASMPIIYDALFATGFTMAGLGLVAYNIIKYFNQNLKLYNFVMLQVSNSSNGVAHQVWPLQACLGQVQPVQSGLIPQACSVYGFMGVSYFLAPLSFLIPKRQFSTRNSNLSGIPLMRVLPYTWMRSYCFRGSSSYLWAGAKTRSEIHDSFRQRILFSLQAKINGVILFNYVKALFKPQGRTHSAQQLHSEPPNH